MGELKKECKERSLKVSGTKAELIERLEEYMQQHEGAEIEEDDLLEEPDVSLEEESKENQEEEKAAEKKSPLRKRQLKNRRKLRKTPRLKSYLERKDLVLSQKKSLRRRKIREQLDLVWKPTGSQKTKSRRKREPEPKDSGRLTDQVAKSQNWKVQTLGWMLKN